MAASCASFEVDEYQVTSATAAESSKSSNEAHIIKSWTDCNNHCVDYVEEPISESKICENSNEASKYLKNGNDITGNHCDDEEWSKQEESFFENKIQIADESHVNEDKMNSDIHNNISDCKVIICEKENERFKNLNGKLQVSCLFPATDEIEKNQKILKTYNRSNETILDNEYCEKNKRDNNETKIAPINSSRLPNADKTIGSNKSEPIKNIERLKNDCDKEKMEISSKQSRAHSQGDDVIISMPNTKVPRGEATRKVVHISVKDNRARSPRRTRQFASARNAIGNRRESRDRETDIVAPCTKGGARRCENYGETHSSYDRQFHMQKYSGYLNRDDAATTAAAATVVYETMNQDATKNVANRRNDSTKLTAPIATASLYRSRSLPRLSLHDSGIACSDHVPVAPEQTHVVSRQLVADLRQFLTLKQHYYPEGGWGWVILLVSLLVQILSHGAHGAVGVFLQQVTVKFGSHVHLQAGYKYDWRIGLQAVTGVVFLTFILGTFYRSASLYHPQRRAILHLKNQKRKIKDKNKADDRPPFFDFSILKSKTVRILLVSTGISAFGINTPIFYLAHQVEEEGLGDAVVLLQAYLGLAWTLGCVAFGLLVVHRSVECRIARQYLTQAAVFVCGLCILALTAVQGNYHGYVMFAWIYGIFCGGYHYSLKMYTYERVRARNFARTWGFVQCSQAIPIAIGVPISGYINVGCGGKAGYYFSSTCVLVGSFTLFFIDLHRRTLSKHKHRVNGTKHTCASDNCPQRRKPSFSQEPENEGPHVAAAGAAGATAAAVVLGADIVPVQGEVVDVLGTNKPELTCISEEGIADMDLPDNLLEDLDYIGDCITSCNKVENYLMLSEFENNLIAEMPIIMDRRGRRWSLARSKTNQSNCGQTSGVQSTADEEEIKSKWRITNVSPNANTRMITVIDEASA
ncbi:hypothetical protein ACFW04_000030 [Cataglyphis niger]